MRLLLLLLPFLVTATAVAQPVVNYYESYSSGTGLQYYVEFDQTMDTNTLTTSTIKVFGSMSGAFPVQLTVDFYDPGAGGALKSVGGRDGMRTATAYHYLMIGLGKDPLPGEGAYALRKLKQRNKA